MEGDSSTSEKCRTCDERVSSWPPHRKIRPAAPDTNTRIWRRSFALAFRVGRHETAAAQTTTGCFIQARQIAQAPFVKFFTNLAGVIDGISRPSCRGRAEVRTKLTGSAKYRANCPGGCFRNRDVT